MASGIANPCVGMDIIGSLPGMPATPSPSQRQQLLSPHVTGPRYFFLDLTTKARGWALALGGREQCEADYLVDRSHYAYHVLEYVAAGKGEVCLDGGRHPLGPGSLFAYAPDTRCRIGTDPAEPMLKFFFALSGKATPKRLAEAGIPTGAVRKLAAHAEIRSVAEDLVREGGRSGPNAVAICAALMELLLLKISDTAAWSDHGSPIARENFLRCKALIDARAERYLNLGDIAEDAGMDVSSICRLFRRFQGSSPYQYLLRRKMNLAAELLVDSGCLVKEAAQRVGFSDPFHFARCFRAVHGVPPSAVRGFGGGP